MVQDCCACKNVYLGNGQLSFHRFPKDEELRKQWAEILEVKEIKKSHNVCSDHFDISSFSSKSRLLKDALPIKSNNRGKDYKTFHHGLNYIIKDSKKFHIAPLKNPNVCVNATIKEEIEDEDYLLIPIADSEFNVTCEQEYFSYNNADETLETEEIFTKVEQNLDSESQPEPIPDVFSDSENNEGEMEDENALDSDSDHSETSNSETSTWKNNRARMRMKRMRLKPNKKYFIHERAYQRFLDYNRAVRKENQSNVSRLKYKIAKQQKRIDELMALLE